MVRSDTEKFLGTNLPSEYVDMFWDKVIPKGSKASKGQVVKAMADLWLDLPEDARNNYLYPISDRPLAELIRQVVQEELVAYRKALSPSQRRAVDKSLQETKGKIHQK